MSCKTGENLEFYMKKKQKQMLASGKVSVCLSHSIKMPEKRRALFLFSFSVSDEVPGEIAGR